MHDDNYTIGWLDVPYSEQVWATYSVRITKGLLRELGYTSLAELVANVRAGEIDAWDSRIMPEGEWGDAEDAEVVETMPEDANITGVIGAEYDTKEADRLYNKIINEWESNNG